jgi:hypothetical protein
VSWFRKKRRKDEAPPAPAASARPTRSEAAPSEPPARPVPRPEPRSEPRAEPKGAPTPPAPAAPGPVTGAETRQAEFVLAEGIVTQESIREQIARADAESTPLGRALLGLNYPSIAEVARVLGRVATPRIDIDRIMPSDEALGRLPAETARARDCLPLEVFGNIICVAMARPEDLSGVEEVRKVTGLRVKALRADGASVRALIERHYAVPRERRFKLRPLPVSRETYERAVRRNQTANEIARDWDAVWVQGEVRAAEPVEAAIR